MEEEEGLERGLKVVSLDLSLTVQWDCRALPEASSPMDRERRPKRIKAPHLAESKVKNGGRRGMVEERRNLIVEEEVICSVLVGRRLGVYIGLDGVAELMAVKVLVQHPLKA